MSVARGQNPQPEVGAVTCRIGVTPILTKADIVLFKRKHLVLFSGTTALHLQVRRERPAHRRPQAPVRAPRRRRRSRRVQRGRARRPSQEGDVHGGQAQRLQRSRSSRPSRPPPATLRAPRGGMKKSQCIRRIARI